MSVLVIYLLIIPAIFFIWKAESKIELLLLVFINTYTIFYIIANIVGLRVDVSSENDTNSTNMIFISLLYLFYLGYCLQRCLLRKNILKTYKVLKIKNINYLYNSLLLLLLFVELNLTSFDIFKNSHIYGNDTKDTYFFEYINVIYVFYIYSNKNKISKTLLFFMLAHSLLAIADGHRLMALTTLLLIFIVTILPKISKKSLVIFILLAYFFLETVSMLRSGLNVQDIFSNEVREESFSTHQGSVIYSTLSLISFADSLSYSEKIILSTQYTLSLLGSGDWLPDELIFTNAFTQYTYRPGGGLLFGFFYAFFGWLGALLAGYFVSYALSWGRYFDNEIDVPPFAYLLVILLPRYYAYTPIHIFKTILFTILLYYFLQLIVRETSK